MIQINLLKENSFHCPGMRGLLYTNYFLCLGYVHGSFIHIQISLLFDIFSLAFTVQINYYILFVSSICSQISTILIFFLKAVLCWSIWQVNKQVNHFSHFSIKTNDRIHRVKNTKCFHSLSWNPMHICHPIEQHSGTCFLLNLPKMNCQFQHSFKVRIHV